MTLQHHQNLPKKAYNLEFFFELSPDFMCIAGFDGFFKKINAAVIDTLGYTEKELFEKPIVEFIHPDDRDLTVQKRSSLLKSLILTQFENRYVHKNGNVVWLQWSSIALEKEEVVYAIAKNITAKKNVELQRNVLLQNLSEDNKKLKFFNYSTSHDLRSPLSNLTALHQLIETKEIEDPELKEYIQLLKLATQNLNEIICTNMDDWIKKDQSSIEVKKIQLKDAVSYTCSSIEQLLRQDQAHIHTDFEEAPEVYFSANYLHSILLNLFTNSIKYAKPGVPAVICLKSEKRTGKIILTYSDNGLGIDMEKAQDRIFKLHQRFQEPSENSKGIGLYLIHNHLTSLGGSISVSSVPNEGTTFVLEFKDAD